jgi:hypothetical protein
MNATIALPLLGLGLFLLLEFAVDRASRRMFERDPQGLYVAARFGHRAALDVLALSACWLFVKPGLEIPATVDLLGLALPVEHLYLLIGAALLFFAFRLRLALRWA